MKQVIRRRYEGANISWDEQICVGYEVTERAVARLCRDMNARRRKLQKQKGLKAALPSVTISNLENWKAIKKVKDGYLASNAFVLLTSDYFPFSKIQCGVFKGTDRAVFLDKREFSGPLYEQIDAAVNFVLRNIRLSAKIEGLQRVESYELPYEAIREMIVNAQCHRNFTVESCVQVAVFDDRLEVTSPGGLYNGLTFEEALQGHSRLRNRVVANIFSQIGLIEAWGTGLQRIQNLAKTWNLRVEFFETSETFRVNLYRNTELVASSSEIGGKIGGNDGNLNDVGGNIGGNGGNSTDVGGNIGGDGGNSTDVGGKVDGNGGNSTDIGGDGGNFTDIGGKVGGNGGNSTDVGGDTGGNRPDDVRAAILNLIVVCNKATVSEIAKSLGLSKRTTERLVKELREEGRLIRRGATRGGYWEVKPIDRDP